MIDIIEHSKRMSFFLHTVWNHETSSNWFHVASGIKNVDYDGISYDDSFYWCRPSYEYEIAKQEIHNELVAELIQFNFIWSGLECLINELDLENCPNYPGKINNTCYYLKLNYEPFNSLKLYSDLIIQLQHFLEKNHYLNLLNRFTPKEYIGHSGIGLSVVYKLRNQFAHGDFVFPEPEDWTFKKPYEKEIIHISSRIILLSIQMLMITFYKDRNEVLGYHPNEEMEGMPVLDYLQYMHYEEILFNRNQYKLDFS